jgi:peptide/nickel transport system substrate-binding protein
VRKHAQVPVLVALAAAALVLVSGFGSSGSKQGVNASQNTNASSSSSSKIPFEGPTGGKGKPGGTYTEAWDTSFSFTNNFDPTGEYLGDAWGIFTNLIVRTLVSYKHTEGPAGNTAVPDLATALPKPTNGGKTYTFKLKSGIKFGPPVNREITSQDIAYAMKRLANPKDGGEYAFYYDGVIKGWSEYAAGKAKTISGISTPNNTTIAFTLVQPTGDFLLRMAMPATGPIPQEVAKCFEGKPGGYGRDLVSSGPYMLLGSDKVKAGSCPIKPMAGYNGSTNITLVRNPSYSQKTDPYRKNLPDKFVFVTNANPSDIVNRVQSGAYSGANLQPPPNVLQQYATDSSRKSQLHVNPGDRTWYLTMNLTQQPFDDIHVRKAMNFVMDKVGLRKAWGGPLAGEVATHVLPPTMIANFGSYNPYASAGDTGDAAKAMAEIKKSKYDTNHDGKCDVAAACKNVLLIADTIHQYTAMVPVITSSAAKIGIVFKVRTIAHAYPTIQTTSNNIPIADRTGWGKDYPDPVTFFAALFTSGAIIPQGNSNYSLVGVTAALNKSKKLGIKGSLKGIPSIDSQYARCNKLGAEARNSCWEGLDKYLMTQVVPWVPYLWQTPDRITGPSVTHWDWDQFSTTTAYSQVAVK